MIQNTSDRHVTAGLSLDPGKNVKTTCEDGVVNHSEAQQGKSYQNPPRNASSMPFLDVPSAGESSSAPQSDSLPHLKLKSSDPGPAAVPRKGAR